MVIGLGSQDMDRSLSGITMRKLGSKPDKTDLRLAKVLKIPAVLDSYYKKPMSLNLCYCDPAWCLVGSCVFIWLLLCASAGL